MTAAFRMLHPELASGASFPTETPCAPLVPCVWYSLAFFGGTLGFQGHASVLPTSAQTLTQQLSAVSLRLYLALRRLGPFETYRKWSFSRCQREVSAVAVGPAIQPGETESAGTPKDVLSGLVVCLNPRALTEPEGKKPRLFPDLRTFVQSCRT